MKFSAFAYILAGLIGALPASAWAARGDSALSHALTVGTGVSSPSQEGALANNPSGLIYTTGVELFPFVRSNDSGFSPLDLGADVFLGNGAVGAGLGFEQNDDLNIVSYGLGISMETLDLSFGVGGTYRFDDDFEGTELNVGMLYKPHGKVSIGAAAYGILNDIDALGLGAAFELGPNATFALDGATDIHFDGTSLKPALGIHLNELQMTIGYGFAVDSDKRGARIADGTSVGLGVRLGDSVHLRAYYNQFLKYSLGLMIRI